MRGAKSGDRVIGSSGDRKIKGFADGPMTLWSDGPISSTLFTKSLPPRNYSYSPEGYPAPLLCIKGVDTSSAFSWTRWECRVHFVSMQREKQNTLFEQWL